MNHTQKTPLVKQGYHADFMDSESFAKARFQHSWLIDKILVNEQPGVIGGAKKTLKTSIGIDMAISLGTGTPFFGEFEVPEQVRVGFFSDESGEPTVLQTAKRICKARNVILKEAEVLWSFRLPCLNRSSDRNGLKNQLRDNEVKVAIIDPLYLCLLGGTKSISASNLYEMGPLLWRVGQACLDAGATPILIHHSTKEAAKRKEPSQPSNLDDLAFSGIGEYARQWLMISRRELFDPSTGNHRLLVGVGGSAGHAGCWEVDVEEGVLDEDFTGRTWDVSVRRASAGGARRRDDRDVDEYRV